MNLCTLSSGTKPTTTELNIECTCKRKWGFGNLNKEGLEVVAQPVAVRVRVHHSEKDIPGLDSGTFWYSTDGNRQFSAVFAEDVFPTLPVERKIGDMLLKICLGFIDFF